MNNVCFTPNQAYYLMYYTLDFYYFDKERDNSVGSILGDINPGEDISGIPDSSDPAAYYDWKNIILKFNFPEKLTEEQAFQVVIEFLLFYNTSFAIPSEKVVKYFEKEGTNAQAWKDAVKKLTLQLDEQENESN